MPASSISIACSTSPFVFCSAASAAACNWAWVSFLAHVVRACAKNALMGTHRIKAHFCYLRDLCRYILWLSIRVRPEFGRLLELLRLIFVLIGDLGILRVVCESTHLDMSATRMASFRRVVPGSGAHSSAWREWSVVLMVSAGLQGQISEVQ